MDEHTHNPGRNQGTPGGKSGAILEPAKESGPSGGFRPSHAKRRAADKPKFVQVERRFVVAAHLEPAHALALAAISYRARRGARVNVATLQHWFGWSRWKVWRVLRALRERGLVSADGDMTPACAEIEGPGGSLRVPLDLLPLGDLEALALTQLASWGTLRMVRRSRGYAEVRQRALARFLGCCARTIGALLERLATGLTVGVRRARRRGKRPVVRPLLELDKAPGRPTYMRLLAEREAARRAAPSPAPTRAPESGSRFVPEFNELEAMIGAGRTGPPGRL